VTHPDPKRLQRAQRELDAEHQPRTLRSDLEAARISKADERDLTARVRRAERHQQAEEQARLDAELEQQRATVARLADVADEALLEIKRVVGYLDHAGFRRLNQARSALRSLKSRYGRAE
jgi:hypothetical protein